MKKENIEEKEEKDQAQADTKAAESPVEEKEPTEGELSELDKVKSELAESKDKFLRLYSEFENFRRRTSKEKLELVQTASEKLIVELLPVMDDFERAEKSIEEKASDDTSVKEGFLLIKNKFNKVLEQKGLKTMDHKAGTAFDPDIHEAITQIPAPEEKLKGKVVDVIEKGYFLNDKVIRFAKVVIGN